MAICPRDGAPLIPTMAFAQAEFYCLECGSRLGYMEPQVASPPTAECIERWQDLQEEWDTHVAGKLLTAGGWRTGCLQCDPAGSGETHEAHATPEERAAHERALTWLRQRQQPGRARS